MIWSQLGTMSRRLLVIVLLFWPLAQARADDPQIVVDQARITVQQFLGDKSLDAMHVYVQNAYAVLIVPSLYKGGLIIGGEYGMGLLFARDTQTGKWSDPAFYEMYGGSIGFQIGGQSQSVMLTLMNETALQKLMTNKFKFGADASIAMGPVGRGIGAGSTANFGEDVYVFNRGAGLFGGLALGGSYVNPREDWNQAYYGQSVPVADIFKGGVVSNSGSTEIRDLLAKF